MQNCDVVFLGGGLASSLAARFLKRRNPALSVLVLEKATQARWNPGESSVGVTGLFLIRDLGLSTYAYLNLLPKNGLRFFFTKEDEPFDLTKCSEIGTNILPILPTFQIDRKRINEDLWRLNSELGVELRLGASITELTVGRAGASHLVRFRQDGRDHEVRARWLVNGAGRASAFAPVFNGLSPLKEDPDHRTAAAWGRFTNVRDIDQLGDEAWRKRVGFTSRYLSTNHMMGKGYWIWAIPIGRDVVSFGVVFDKEVLGVEAMDNDAFLAFMREHPIAGALLDGAKQEDFQAHRHLPFKRARFCSEDRWAFVGDAFMFVDPFYSPGSDVISREAYLLEHLVRASDEELPELARLVNAYEDHEYEVLKSLYLHQYAGFGSFEVYNIKSLWDFHAYTNRIVWPFYARAHADRAWLRGQLDAGPMTLKLTRAMQNGFIALREHLESRGLSERRNLGEYSPRQNRFLIEEEILRGYSEKTSLEQHLHLCRLTISELVACRFGSEAFGRKRIVQDCLTFAVMQDFELTQAWLDAFLERVGRLLSLEVERRTGAAVEARAGAACLEREVPAGFAAAPEEARREARALWAETAVNIVKDSLVR